MSRSCPPKKKMGRPPKPQEQRRAAALTLRLTEAERVAAQSLADKAGQSLSDWVRVVISLIASGKMRVISDDPVTG
jgi:hypothetical protein